METEAARRPFLRAAACGFRYNSFIGDGDSAAYHANIYGREHPVFKFDCINYVSKRLGKRLINLKQGMTEVRTSASGRRYKRLIFAGTLTKNQIDQLAKFFTWSLSSTVYTSVQEMRETIMASYYHHSSSDFQPMHYYCPQGENLWC